MTNGCHPPKPTPSTTSQAVLSKCEWGKDDYSLEIKNLPAQSDADLDSTPPPKSRAERKARSRQEHLPLFDNE